jgi:hypothetical protein
LPLRFAAARFPEVGKFDLADWSFEFEIFWRESKFKLPGLEFFRIRVQGVLLLFRIGFLGE